MIFRKLFFTFFILFSSTYRFQAYAAAEEENSFLKDAFHSILNHQNEYFFRNYGHLYHDDFLLIATGSENREVLNYYIPTMDQSDLQRVVQLILETGIECRKFTLVSEILEQFTPALASGQITIDCNRLFMTAVFYGYIDFAIEMIEVGIDDWDLRHVLHYYSQSPYYTKDKYRRLHEAMNRHLIQPPNFDDTRYGRYINRLEDLNVTLVNYDSFQGASSSERFFDIDPEARIELSPRVGATLSPSL